MQRVFNYLFVFVCVYVCVHVNVIHYSYLIYNSLLFYLKVATCWEKD